MAKKKPTITVSKKKKSKSTKGKAKQNRFTFTDLPDELAERGREIWLAGLGALSMVEEEGTKLFQNLVQKGETWEKEGRKQLGAVKEKLDAAREKVEDVVDEAATKGSKITELDDMILARVEGAVERVLQRLGVPTHAEVKDLAGKVEKLSGEVVTLAAVIEQKKNGAANDAGTTVYHVVPDGDGWAVKQEGVAAPLSTHGTKKEALTAGQGLAEAHVPSRLVIHKQDGTVQRSRSFDA